MWIFELTGITLPPATMCTALVAMLICLNLVYLFRRIRLPFFFPPGPMPLPVVGNLLDVGLDLKAAFQRWSALHGSIVGFRLGSALSVVISDFDLLEQTFKDERYAGRPSNLQEIFSAFFGSKGEKSTGGIVFSHGEYWKEQRKFAMKTLNKFGMGRSQIQNVINDEVMKLVEDLRKVCGTPVDLRLRTNMAVVNTLWLILNGEKSDLSNPRMQEVFKSTTEFVVSNSLSGPVMIMPWLRHLPYFNTQFEQARRSPQEMKKVTSESINKHKQRSQDAEDDRDFIDSYLRKVRETTDPKSSFFQEVGEGNLQRTMMDLFGAGSETTASILCFAFNYLIRFPEIQQRAQAEIAAVIGNRVPSLEDRPNLPYMDALIHEVLRYACIVYTTPHATTEDVVLQGYRIPKGTSIYPNVWGIMNDPKHWEQPEKFMPERFLNAEGQFVKNSRCIPFLIGKRYCLGQQLAQHELFLFLTGLLQHLQFSTVLDDHTEVNIEPEVGFLHTCPMYEVIITERK